MHTVKVPVRGDSGEITGVLGIFWDVTERHRAQERIRSLNRMYRTISLCNQALVRSRDEVALADGMCRILVNDGGFKMAWVGLAENDASRTVVPVAAAGVAMDYLRELGLTWAENDPRGGPVGEAIRSGQPVVVGDMGQDFEEFPWRAEASRLGVRSILAAPLAGNGGMIGAIAVCGAERDAFGKEETGLMAKLAGDLGFGIANLRDRAAHLGALEKLETSLDHAVTAIAATVEMRDPYTAGHQRRVAKLAVAIATEMGLEEPRIEGLRIAGVVHDIGKIHVPAEILASPAKLTDAEFSIITTHCQAGYDILKGIDFPWPVADIVLQHHEKLDGTGYPSGLTEEKILLEARILTVADVVEAMASHRPYRPGFGVFPALQEISRGKGRCYDPAVVDACLRLFLQKGYEL